MGNFSLLNWVKDLCSYQTVWSTRPPAYPFTLVRFPNNAALIVSPDTTWRIGAGAKFHPSLHLKLSHRGGCGELVQDPRMQAAVWSGLLWCSLMALEQISLTFVKEGDVVVLYRSEVNILSEIRLLWGVRCQKTLPVKSLLCRREEWRSEQVVKKREGF